MTRNKKGGRATERNPSSIEGYLIGSEGPHPHLHGRKPGNDDGRVWRHSRPRVDTAPRNASGANKCS